MEMVWDGETTKEPTVDAESNVYVISTPSEWAYLCISDQNYATKNIELAADLDFGGHELGSIQLNGNGLYVDGKGYTIRNMKLVGDNKCISNLGTYCASLFCSPQGSTKIQNLTVKNAQVVCEHKDMDPTNPKGHAAVIFADLEPNAKSVTLENVHVIAADVYGIQPVAGLIGRNGSVPVTITNCSVEDSHFHNVAMVDESGYVATLVGRTDDTKTITIKSATSTNNTIDAYWTNNRGEESIQELAPVGVVVENVTHSGNVVNKTKLADAIVSDTEGLLAALAAGKSEIELQAGTYELGGASFGAATTDYILTGTDKENVIVKMQASVYGNNSGSSVNKKLTFTNLTLNTPTSLSYAEGTFGFFQHFAALTFSDCNIIGGLRIDGQNTLVENCQFTNTVQNGFDGYAIFYYGESNSEMTVNDCTFNTMSKGIVMYSESKNVYTLNVNRCTFNSSVVGDKCAIQMHTEKGISGTLNVTKTTAIGFRDLNCGLWQDCNNETGVATKKFTVTVDGETVQKAE